MNAETVPPVRPCADELDALADCANDLLNIHLAGKWVARQHAQNRSTKVGLIAPGSETLFPHRKRSPASH
jgi:hypothetical protein